MQTFGLNTLANPIVADMENYLQNGQATAWPYCGTLDKCLACLDECIKLLGQKGDWQLQDDNDIELMSSTTSYIGSSVIQLNRVLGIEQHDGVDPEWDIA
eukprot:5241519-Ditylum_brightwellii.AAC.1